MASIINAATSGGLVTTADTSGVLQLQTASTTAVTVTASQNVGIGTASPGARLHAVSSASSGVYGAIIYNQSATGQGLTVRAGSTSSEDTFNCQTYDGGLSLFTILGNGNVVIPTGTLKTVSTISVGNATPSTSGAGITFPATASDSSSANTLDDYEEGTWSYDFTATTGTITKSATFVNGFYTKVGRVVTITGFLQVLSVSSPTGSLSLTGLPFPIGSTGARENYVGSGIFGTILATGSVSPLMINGQNGHSYLTISKFVAGSSADLAGDVIADTRFYISFSYFV